MTLEANPRIPLTMTAEVEAYIRAEFPSVYIAQLVTELDAERAARALLQSQFDNLRRDKEQGDKQNALILADYRKEVAAHAETREQLAMERSLKETLHKGVDDLGTLCGELQSQLAGTLENASSIAVKSSNPFYLSAEEELQNLREAYKECFDQLAETREAWKPIETAPLDRWILGADQDKWMRIKWQPRSAFWSGWPTYEPPTHWMIPDTPKSEATNDHA